MEDTRLYAMLLGIDFPWRISRVQVDMASERIDVWLRKRRARGFLARRAGRTPRCATTCPSKYGGTWIPASAERMFTPVCLGRTARGTV